MVLGGSAGGLAGADLKAALLASHGIAALAVAYFGMEGRPPFLVGIALEDLRLGLSWLCRRPEVAGTTVAVVGGSRGGELALLLGATYPEVGAVVAGAPSGVVWGGVAPEGSPGGAAWTLGGRPLPAMPAWRPELQAEVYAAEPVRLAPLFAEVLGDAEAVEQAGIPVEQTNGPILLVTGDDDAMWPSRRMAEMVERRAAARGFPHPVCHLHYADAGHLCASPPGIVLPSLITHPTDGRRYLFGGTPAGNAAAAAHSWRRTIELVRPSPRQ
jgi:dienelactone hydrolase